MILFYALFYTYLNAYLKRCPEMITDFITPKNTIKSSKKLWMSKINLFFDTIVHLL